MSGAPPQDGPRRPETDTPAATPNPDTMIAPSQADPPIGAGVQERRAREAAGSGEASASSHPAFRPDVEGLRALAVGIVVLYHASLGPFHGGYVGVDVFLVISGFLITGLLMREYEVDGKISVADFYARRFRRILPVASLVIFITLALSMMFLSVTRIAAIARDALWSSVFLANFRFISTDTNYLSSSVPPSPLQHFWSLAVEEQFYFVWPLLLLGLLALTRHRSYGRVVAGAVAALVSVLSFVWCVHQTSTDATVAYFSPLTRAWELGLGAILAIALPLLVKLPQVVATLLAWAGLGLILYSALRFTDATTFPGAAAAVPVLGAGLVLAGGCARPRFGAVLLLGLRPMIFIGGISYSLYLWHWPILKIAQQSTGSLSVANRLVLVAIALLVSAFTYFIYENPIRKAKSLVHHRYRSLALGVGLVMVSALVSNAYVATDNMRTTSAQARARIQSEISGPSSIASTAEVIAAVRKAATVKALPVTLSPSIPLASADQTPAGACLEDYAVTVSGECTFGNVNSTKTVVIYGDSHAAQWLPALLDVAVRAPVKIVLLTKVQCPYPTISVYNTKTKAPYTECDTWRANALERIKSIHPALVLAASTLRGVYVKSSDTSAAESEALWQEGIAQTLTQLKGMADRVVVLSDSPSFATAPAECLSENSDDIGACAATPDKAFYLSNQAQEKATVNRAGVSNIDTSAWTCTATVCPPVIANQIVDYDTTHLTATYSKYLGYALGVTVGLENDPTALAKAASEALKVNSLPTAVANEISSKNFGPQYGGACAQKIGDTTLPPLTECTLGNAAAVDRTLVLFGDSRAAGWASTFDSIGRLYGYRVVLISEAGCNAAAIDQWSSQLNAPNTGCTTWRKAAVERIASLNPALVVIATEASGIALAENGKASYQDVTTRQGTGLGLTIKTIESFGSKVAVLGDIPVLPESAPACLLSNPSAVQKCTGPVAKSAPIIGDTMLKTVANATDAAFVEIAPWLCSGTGCPALIANHVAYTDLYHLSANFAVSAEGALAAALRLTT